MKRNYRIAQGISLEVGGLNLDLYNNFSLDELKISTLARRVAIRFSFEVPFVDASRPQYFSVLFHDVTFFETAYATFGAEDCVVEEVGFKERRDRDLVWLKQEGQELPQDDIIFRISGGRYIRIAADTSEVVLEKPDNASMASS